MLEQQLEKLTAAVIELTAAIKSQTPEAVNGITPDAEPKQAATKKKAAAKKKAAEPEPEQVEQSQYSADDVKARLSELAEKVGGVGPRNILKKHGIAKFSDMQPEQFDAVYADAEAALEAALKEAA